MFNLHSFTLDTAVSLSSYTHLPSVSVNNQYLVLLPSGRATVCSASRLRVRTYRGITLFERQGGAGQNRPNVQNCPVIGPTRSDLFTS